MRLLMRRKQYLVGNRFRNLGHRVKVSCQESRLFVEAGLRLPKPPQLRNTHLEAVVHQECTRSPVNGSLATVRFIRQKALSPRPFVKAVGGPATALRPA